MSSLANVRAAYLVALEAALPAAKVYTHGGAFDAKQLAAYSRQAPAVVLTLLRFDAVRQGGYPVAIAHWGVVCFTKNTTPILKDEACIALMEQVVGVLLPLFGGSTVTQPVSSALKQIQCRNMFGATIDAEGIAMWGAEFAQQLDLVQTDTSVDLKRFHLTYDMAQTEDLETDAEDLLEDLDTTPVV
jgi:hypothetical protein